MKKNKINFIIILTTFFVVNSSLGQININKISKEIKSKLPTEKRPTNNNLSNDEVIKGLKEALNVGIKISTEKASAIGGFLNNDLIRIPFPKDARVVRDKAMQWGLDRKVEKFEHTLNEAAEEACKTAAPIFINAVKIWAFLMGLKF